MFVVLSLQDGAMGYRFYQRQLSLTRIIVCYQRGRERGGGGEEGAHKVSNMDTISSFGCTSQACSEVDHAAVVLDGFIEDVLHVAVDGGGAADGVAVVTEELACGLLAFVEDEGRREVGRCRTVWFWFEGRMEGGGERVCTSTVVLRVTRKLFGLSSGVRRGKERVKVKRVSKKCMIAKVCLCLMVGVRLEISIDITKRLGDLLEYR